MCQRIPREVLEAVYGVNIEKPREGEDPNRPPHADELLNAYGCKYTLVIPQGAQLYYMVFL